MDQENKDLTQEADEDKLVTIDEVFSESDEEECQFMTEKNMKICTFPEGYKPRQAIYSCATCAPSPPFAAICIGCAVNCHEGHKLFNLYTKRRLCCDCGNSRTPNNKCTLYEDKPPENPRNAYDYNFDGNFCMHKCTWNPDEPQAEPMAQCILCEDWFHFSHVGVELKNKESKEGSCPNDVPSEDLICVRCVKKHPWFDELTKTETSFCVSKHMNDGKTGEMKGMLEDGTKTVLLRPDEWRKNICNCKDCLAYLEDAGLDYLFDEDDLLSVYERELNAEKAEETLDEPADLTDLATRMVGDKGPDAVYYAIQGINFFKTELEKMLNECAQRNQVVTKVMVDGFVENLRKRQLEERERMENDAKRARLEGYNAEDYDHIG